MSHAYCLISNDTEATKACITTFIQEARVHESDIFRLESSSSIGISDVREVIRFVYQTPYASPSKIAVIGAATLTPEAQSALLKTLEEPPLKNLILLYTDHEDRLLPTVLSRCKVVYLGNKSREDFSTNNQQPTFWQEFAHQPISKRFATLANSAKDRTLALVWIQDQMQLVRKSFVSEVVRSETNERIYSAGETTRLLRTLQETVTRLQANVSVRLAMDQIALDTPVKK